MIDLDALDNVLSGWKDKDRFAMAAGDLRALIRAARALAAASIQPQNINWKELSAAAEPFRAKP